MKTLSSKNRDKLLTADTVETGTKTSRLVNNRPRCLRLVNDISFPRIGWGVQAAPPVLERHSNISFDHSRSIHHTSSFQILTRSLGMLTKFVTGVIQTLSCIPWKPNLLGDCYLQLLCMEAEPCSIRVEFGSLLSLPWIWRQRFRSLAIMLVVGVTLSCVASWEWHKMATRR